MAGLINKLPLQEVKAESQGRFLDPKSDLVFKKIFGQHPDLTKSFLNSILPLPKGRFIESIQYLTPEQAPRIPSMKNTIVDVKCTDQEGRLFIVEMQMMWSKSFFQRFLYGVSKAYVQQLDSGKEYDHLCPVYGLALVNETFELKLEGWYHHYRLTHTQEVDKTLEGMELVFLELPKFNPQTFEHRRLGVLWLRFLREMGERSDIPSEFLENQEMMKAVELTKEASYSKAELLAYDEYLDADRVRKVILKDAFSEGEERGRREGLKEGEERGRRAGEEKGRKEERYEIARLMLRKGKPVHEIEEFTGMTSEELEELD